MSNATTNELMLFAEETEDRINLIYGELEKLVDCPDGQCTEFVNSVFREIHSLKGASDVLGLRPVVQLFHKLEDILDLIRTGAIKPRREVVDLLLNTLDYVSDILSNLAVAKFMDVGQVLGKIDRELAHFQ